MAKKSNLSRKKVGWALRVYDEDRFGPEWKRVGFLFGHRDEAIAYKDKNFPKVKKFTIQGVRVNAVPLTTQTTKDESKAVA